MALFSMSLFKTLIVMPFDSLVISSISLRFRILFSLVGFITISLRE